MLTLAAFAYYQGSSSEAAHRQPYTELTTYVWPTTIWSEVFGEGDINLRVLQTHDGVKALLVIDLKLFKHSTNLNFRQFEDLTIAVANSCAAGGYEAINSTSEGGEYCFLNFSSDNRIRMDKTHFDELKAVFAECTSDEKMIRIRAAERLIYGAI